MTARQARQSEEPRRGSRNAAPDPAAPSDSDLIAAINRGDSAAWSTLLTRYQDRLYAVTFRMVSNPDTAADLTQDAMVKIIQGLGSWDGRAALSTWMIRIAMNVTLSHLRAQKLRRHASLEGMAESGTRRASGHHNRGSGGAGTSGSGASSLAQAREPDAGSRVQQDELRERVAGALEALDADQRAILILRDMQDLDYEQIAAVLEIPVGTVKSRLFRARAALRQILEGGADSTSDNPGTDRG